MAVADVYDALRSRRPYKPAFSHSEAVTILIEGRGKQFDPLLIDAFVALQGSFLEIAIKLADE
jgi:putative two-component system response regulator